MLEMQSVNPETDVGEQGSAKRQDDIIQVIQQVCQTSFVLMKSKELPKCFDTVSVHVCKRVLTCLQHWNIAGYAPTYMSHSLHSQRVWLTTLELRDLCTCVIGREFHLVTDVWFCRHHVHLSTFTCCPAEGGYFHSTIIRGHQFLRDAWSCKQYR